MRTSVLHAAIDRSDNSREITGLFANARKFQTTKLYSPFSSILAAIYITVHEASSVQLHMEV